MAHSGKNIKFDVDLLPKDGDTYSLGTEELNWKTLNGVDISNFSDTQPNKVWKTDENGVPGWGDAGGDVQEVMYSATQPDNINCKIWIKTN